MQVVGAHQNSWQVRSDSSVWFCPFTIFGGHSPSSDIISHRQWPEYLYTCCAMQGNMFDVYLKHMFDTSN
jgi:hypothetical protein